MTYQLNQLIRASDYNSFAGASGTSSYGSEPSAATLAGGASIGRMYGPGYGSWGWNQSDISLSPVVADALIRTGSWTNLRNILAKIRTHQTGSADALIPSTAVLAANHQIEAHVIANNSYDLPAVIALALANRFQMSGGTLFALANMTRATSWGSSTGGIQGIFEISFADANAAGFFFNTGGYIQFGLTQPVTTTQDADWADAFSTRIGSIRFNGAGGSNTGSVSVTSSVGYYQLTNVYQTVWLGTGANGFVNAHYAANTVKVEALVSGTAANGRPGETLRFRVTCTDTHTGTSDSVSSGTVVTMSAVKDTTNLTTVPATPTGSVITGW